MEGLTPVKPVLLIDDEAPIISGYRMVLSDDGISNLICLTDSREALQIIQQRELDLVLLDLNMPWVSGEELLDAMREHQPGVPVIVVTGRDDVESAVRCMKKGAHDYLVKPVAADRVLTAIRNALQVRDLVRENERLARSFFAEEIRKPEAFAPIITRNAMMRSIFLYIEAIAETQHPVLLTGETGVGKELVARSVHQASGRQGQFVAVNVAGLDDNMFSDTLFGHRKGAFTGAESARVGLIASAMGGTIFLDEIGDLSLGSRVKLLRLLQEHEYTPLGQDLPVKSDARVVVATNVDLNKRMEEGKFRPDLFYRLNTHKIRIPALRERLDDLPLLVSHFLRHSADMLKKKTPTPPKELVSLLSEYSFPGNIRELEAMITDAVSRHKSNMLSLVTFKDHIDATGQGAWSKPASAAGEDLAAVGEEYFGGKLPKFSEVKRLLVEVAMRRSSGNCSRAAELLGTSRQALMWYLKKRGDAEDE